MFCLVNFFPFTKKVIFLKKTFDLYPISILISNLFRMRCGWKARYRLINSHCRVCFAVFFSMSRAVYKECNTGQIDFLQISYKADRHTKIVFKLSHYNISFGIYFSSSSAGRFWVLRILFLICFLCLPSFSKRVRPHSFFRLSIGG